mmetsp:Transcript_38333/g.68490  ORF Transcript_38333/g.68490 Transcript_38333/m.68490 type:complete len:230 (+) Transcript_38333:2209-2898(+)
MTSMPMSKDCSQENPTMIPNEKITAKMSFWTVSPPICESETRSSMRMPRNATPDTTRAMSTCARTPSLGRPSGMSMISVYLLKKCSIAQETNMVLTSWEEQRMRAIRVLLSSPTKRSQSRPLPTTMPTPTTLAAPRYLMDVCICSGLSVVLPSMSGRIPTPQYLKACSSSQEQVRPMISFSPSSASWSHRISAASFSPSMAAMDSRQKSVTRQSPVRTRKEMGTTRKDM